MPLTETPALTAAENKVYVVFYSDKVDGKMWCPDCVKVESVVNDAFDGDDKPRVWRSPTNEARADYTVNNIPTILRLENGAETGRLVEDEILDAAKLKEFVQ